MGWFNQLMQGRYGMDKTNRILMGMSMGFLVIQLLFRVPLLYYLTFITIAFCYFRMFSRDYLKRSKENEIFLKYWNPVGKWFRIRGRQVKELKTHKYFTCAKCRQSIRIPRKKGILEIQCPKCEQTFQGKT